MRLCKKSKVVHQKLVYINIYIYNIRAEQSKIPTQMSTAPALSELSSMIQSEKDGSEGVGQKSRKTISPTVQCWLPLVMKTGSRQTDLTGTWRKTGWLDWNLAQDTLTWRSLLAMDTPPLLAEAFITRVRPVFGTLCNQARSQDFAGGGPVLGHNKGVPECHLRKNLENVHKNH